MTFYAWNDLGNLMGKIARSMRLKWGFQGLRYDHFSDDRSTKIATILLTEDPRIAFQYLGFDWNKCDKGFDTLPNMFDYVIHSKYFAKSVFDDSALNASQRHRDTKRNVYKEFKKYLSECKDCVEHSERPSIEETVKNINEYFPNANVLDTINKQHKRFIIIHDVKQKFNGTIIMQHLNVTGKDLGSLILNVKSSFPSDDDFNDWVLSTPIEEIIEFIKEIEYGSKVIA